MALGNSGIAAARNELSTIGAKVAAAKATTESFKKLFNDANFQKFVAETNKGSLINEQLQKLAEWSNSMCDTVESMKAKTQNYLDHQEALNRR